MRQFLFVTIFFILGGLVCASGATTPQKRDQKRNVFPFPIHEIKLENGLRVVAVPCDSPGVIAYITVVRAGSRNEVEKGCSGFAHFFEHMMFKDTPRFSEGARERELMLVGAETNAFTGDDYTCYHAVGSAKAIEQIMDIQADAFLNLSYSEEQLRTEATVILQEYQKDSSDPFIMLDEKIRDTGFVAHTYKHTVIGFLDDIKKMPTRFDYSKSFFDRFYGPGNCVVVVVGDVDPKNLESLARKYYGNWKARPYELVVPPEPPQKEEKSFHIEWKSETLPYLFIGYHVPAFSDRHPDPAALKVLGDMVFSPVSPLYKKLVLEEQKVEFISGRYEEHRDPYFFTVLSRIKDKADIEYVKTCVFDALETAKKQLIDPGLLSDIKSHCRYSFAMGLDTPESIAFSLADFISLTGDPGSVNRYYRTLDGITAVDVNRVARKYFSPENRTVVTLVNGGEK